MQLGGSNLTLRYSRVQSISVRRKGLDLPIKTVAAIVLGIMVVVLVYAGVSGWFSDLGQAFVGNVKYPAN